MNKLTKVRGGLLSILGFLVILLSGPLQADPVTAADWLAADKRLKEFCARQPLDGDSAKVFADTALKANSIRSDFCARKIATDRDVLIRVFELLDDLGRLLTAQVYSQPMKQLQMQAVLNNQKPKKFEVRTRPNQPGITMSIGDKAFRVTDQNLTQCNNKAKAFNASASCKSALQEFRAIYDFAEATYAQPLVLPLMQHLSTLEKDWNDFYQNARSQTIWEMLINGARFQSDNQEHRFLPPPDSQIIFMHPGLVIENVSDAIDGSQTQEGLMLEVIGINWWRNSKWYKPSGLSAIALYSDRPAVKDVGYGVAIHFANKFTIGYVDRDGVDGYFISVDLLELLKDKKTWIENYRGSLEF